MLFGREKREEKKRKRRRGRKKNVEEGGRGRRGWGVIESGSFSYEGLLIHARGVPTHI